MVGLGVGGVWVVQQVGRADEVLVVEQVDGVPAEQLIFAGDTQGQVYKILGQPNIEFPNDGVIIQWYAGYEVVVSNNVVTHVTMKPVESEEEKLEKERRAKLAEERLKQAYQVAGEKENISYNAWLKREQLRRQKEREERAAVEAYEERRSKEKKAAIYAEAIRKSCGCRRGHHCRH